LAIILLKNSDIVLIGVVAQKYIKSHFDKILLPKKKKKKDGCGSHQISAFKKKIWRILFFLKNCFLGFLVSKF
jgi:hypothetical protein